MTFHNYWKTTLPAILLLISPSLVGLAGETVSPEAGEDINWQVVSGGGNESTGPAFILKGSIAQTTVGVGAAADSRVGSGYWFGQHLPANCCFGIVGDANGSGDYEPTIGDITAMIDMLFITETVVPCIPEADINKSGGLSPGQGDITIGDVSMLIDYLFITGSTGMSLPPC
jgi:hypothetical protein